jgi:glycosyltransferase involved in cell wall biosynthesis
MRVQLVDPSSFTPPYDHALASALARAGAEVELIAGEFPYGSVPAPDGYRLTRGFYAHVRGPADSWRRRAGKLAWHVPEMLRLRRHAQRADVVHFQWLDVQWLDSWLLPARPRVLTAHDLLPREPRPGQTAAQRALYERMDAIVVHSDYGARRLIDGLGLAPERVHVIHHGAFEHLALAGDDPDLPAELAAADVRVPVVLFFGLLRPYKGIEVLLEAWRELFAAARRGERTGAGPAAGRRGEEIGAELWIVGRPRMELESLRAAAPPGVRLVARYVSDRELAACFRRADVVVLPYLSTERFDFSGVMATALAFAKPIVVSDIGGLGEVARAGGALAVVPGDARALAGALEGLLSDGAARAALSARARALAAGPYSWREAAARTLELYRQLTARA